MRALLLLMVWELAACAPRHEGGPSRAKCVQLRERIVELRLADLPPSDVALHRRALLASLGDEFVDHCQELTTAEATCALAAKDTAAIAACSQSK